MTEKTFEAPSKELLEKYEKLKEYFKDLGSVAIAYSSGVDSTLLLYTAYDVLKDRCLAVTASSCSFPKRELNEATDFCKKIGVRHLVVESEELNIEGFSSNPPNRCYLCKKELFEKIFELANSEGITYVAEGSNLDDNGDYRPGLMAINELGAKSPLREVGFTKEEIRILSAHLGLYTASKPSFACLASRFPYGEVINEKKLMMVDKAEQLLLDLGFEQFRVRIHGDNVARIELLPQDFGRMLDGELRDKVYESFKGYGFTYVSLDLKGYRTGSMNETLNI
ncbi:MAG: ATP-dependent sacrificial sulfur transferase LarE [Lachnospiraceae bacterium]|nr:ATP-dependent sacrificial sulfur transferase LarE [Lachnospiraceae bacterium]